LPLYTVINDRDFHNELSSFYTKLLMLILSLASALALALVSGAAVADVVVTDFNGARQETPYWTDYALNPYPLHRNLELSMDEEMAPLTATVEGEFIHYHEVFDAATIAATKKWVLLEKCGWLCMRLGF